MTDAEVDTGMLPAVEAELLVATFTPEAELIYRNGAWQSVFGGGQAPWERLSEEDHALVVERVRQAGAGVLMTNHLCTVQTIEREEPLPVLMNFLPIHLPASDGELHFKDEGARPAVRAVSVTGEVLAEPSSWTMSQTQRHRMETLGRMTMGIAHDFNNLLSALLGHTELLKEQVGQKASPFKQSLDTIEQVAVDGASLVEKIQRYIRQETQSNFEPLDLTALLEGCITLTRPYWYNEPRRRGIAIAVDAVLEDVPPVMGSATELREVFVNLFLNAVQAMPKGGTITIRTFFDEKRGVGISIADDGQGMNEALRERIFEPLFTTKGSQGSGMGLTVTYGIVQEHEGEIEVDSTPGRGTRFDLYFPPAEEPGAAAPAAGENKTARPVRVLVVDDEPRVRSVLSKLLTLKGHTVEQAASGAEALAHTEHSDFDIVFTDHAMPAMDGTQLARALRRRFRDLPIVLLTGDTDVPPVEEVNRLMSKPFKLVELEAVIQELVV